MSNKRKKPYSVPKRTIENGNVNNNRINNKVNNNKSNNYKSNYRTNVDKNKKYNSDSYRKNNNKSNRDFNKKNDLELTTRIRIDEERINDFETLDTSFLEGRMDKRVKNNSKAKEKILKKKEPRKSLKVIKKLLLLIVVVIVFAGIIFAFSKISKEMDNTHKKEKKTEEKVVKKQEIDDNYLFIGDFYTEEFDFEELDYHYVKVSDKDLTTSKVLEDMNEKIYKYNPSKIFIQLGIKDLDEEKSDEEILDNFSEIIDEITLNRPYALIYVESLYPINKDVEDYDDEVISNDIDNKRIKDFNTELSKLCKKKKVEFIDLNSILSDDGKLKDDYTDDGVKLNEDAYKEILKEIKKNIG